MFRYYYYIIHASVGGALEQHTSIGHFESRAEARRAAIIRIGNSNWIDATYEIRSNMEDN